MAPQLQFPSGQEVIIDGDVTTVDDVYKYYVLKGAFGTVREGHYSHPHKSNVYSVLFKDYMKKGATVLVAPIREDCLKKSTN